MSTTYTPASVGGRRSPRTRARASHFFGRLAERMRARRDRNLTIATLSQLDDKMLDDIGVARYDIEAIADERFNARMRNLGE